MKNYRKDFPFFETNNKVIWFDSGATSLKHHKVIEAEYDYLTKYTANHHARDHENGIRANALVAELRTNIKNFINAESEKEIILTNGTTHGLQMIIFGLRPLIDVGQEILTTDIEHSVNIVPWIKVAQEKSAVVKTMPIDKTGKIIVDRLDEVVNDKTRIVAFNHISNTMGATNDAKAISKKVRSINPNVIIVLDCAQSSAHKKIDVRDFDVDFVSFSAHKMFGSYGIGTIYGSFNLLNQLQPLFYGGGATKTISHDLTSFELLELPDRLEVGTLNTSGIAGFNACLKVVNEYGLENIYNYEKEIKAYFVEQIKLHNLEKGFIFYNLDVPTSIVIFTPKRMDAKKLSLFADKKYHIAMRAGKHEALRMHDDVWHVSGTNRATFTIYNTKDEIDIFIKMLLDQEKYN